MERTAVETVMAEAMAARRARLQAGENLEAFGLSDECPTCRGARYVRERKLAQVDSGVTLNPTHYETQVRPCPACGAAAAEVLGAPELKTFGSWREYPDMAAARAACMELVEGRRWCVFLRGRPGCGKTHLAIATAHAWAERNGRAIFANVPVLLDELRNCYATERPVQPVLDKYAGARFLVLDDFGAERAKEFAVETLYKLIDRRYTGKLPTIVTTNWLRDDFDPRVKSRLGPGEIVIAAGDRRKDFE